MAHFGGENVFIDLLGGFLKSTVYLQTFFLIKITSLNRRQTIENETVEAIYDESFNG